MGHSTMRTGLLAAGISFFSSAAAFAQDALPVIGAPTDKGLGFQPAATELARDLQGLDSLLLTIITIITIFVAALIVFVMVRFN